jgi:hypothetical protein
MNRDVVAIIISGCSPWGVCPQFSIKDASDGPDDLPTIEFT